MNRSRPVLNSTLNEIKMRMSTKSKVPSHYETLEVTNQSTQDDIKSAYYKLSKKYHPDVNTSSDAKRKFQNISDAYEILGNFNKRKQYDRDLTARGEKATVRRTSYQEPTVEVDPLAGFYKSRMANYDPLRTSNTKAQFDFDAWTKAHYGQTLKRSLRDKSSKILREQLKKDFEEEIENNRTTTRVVAVTSLILAFSLMMQSYFSLENYDKNLVARKDKKAKET